MRLIFPILTLISWGLALSCLSQSAAFAQTPPSATQLLTQAAARLHRERAFETRLRQRIDLFGHQLIGSGAYLQSASGAEQRQRLELKLQVGGHVSSIQQICNGRRLWIRHDLAEGARLVQIDLRRVRSALKDQPAGPPAAGGNRTLGVEYWLAGGGISSLLAGLHENFHFSTVKTAADAKLPAELGKQVWLLRGRWKQHREQANSPANSPAPLRGHLPAEVMVTLCRGGSFPLFPLRIAYLRPTENSSNHALDGAGQGRGGAAGRPLMTLEFFQMRRLNRIDDRRFEYFPGDQPIEDGTEAFLAKLRTARY